MAKVTRTPGDGRKRLAEALEQLQGVTGQVGWFESAKYANGTSVAYVATIQEYGYAPKHIAPRMGLRGMIEARQAEWARFAERGAKGVLDGSMTAIEAMDLIGGRAEADIRKQIASVKEPVLAEATLKARARRMGLEDVSDLTATGMKPLNDTGLMIATVSHIVLENGGIVAGKKKSGVGDS